jgi:HEXXH motif-containing protein
MTDLLGFAPSRVRAEQLSARMHDELARSLSHISEVAPDVAAHLRPVVALAESGQRLPPVAFGLYFDLAEHLLRDDPAGATALAHRLGAVGPAAQEMSVLDRGTPAAAPLEAVLAARMGGEFDGFAPVDPARAAAFRPLLAEGIALLDAGYPALADEIRAIVGEVLLAEAPPGATMEFDGASHYQFWGLLMLNPKHHRTPLAVAEVLAHEAGHSLLFGMTVDEPLVLNPDDELYPSPLRVDPRPMDGIYHATFVSARMALAMETLAASGVLSADDRAAALEAARDDRANFAAGDGVIRAHGRLSATGAAILQGARDWIAG